MLVRRSHPPIPKLLDPARPTLPGPVSPLERNPQSPKGWKNRESDGVGLGIVAALEKSESGKISDKIKYVSAPICIGGNNSTWRGTAAHELGCQGKCNSGCYEGSGLFCVSPPRPMTDDLPSYHRMADFLNYCYLCRKRLHGKDIYMYRGERAFCSMECRFQQIATDEFHEKCGSEALRPSDASRSSYTDDRLFFTGIAAA